MFKACTSIRHCFSMEAMAPVFRRTESPVGRNQIIHLPRPFPMAVHLSDLFCYICSDGDSAIPFVNLNFI